MAIARALVVDMAMNTGKILNDVKRVRKGFDGMRTTIGKTGKALAAAFTVQKIYNFTMDIIQSADELAKFSQQVGISVEALSEYHYAAKLAGATSQDVDSALRTLGKNMRDAVIQPTGEAARALRELGVTVQRNDGSLRSVEDVMQDVAARYAGMQNGAQKAGTAMKILGDSGAKLIPLLNNLESLETQARDAGATVSTEFARSAESFNDSIARITEKTKSYYRDIITGAHVVGSVVADAFDYLTGEEEDFLTKAYSKREELQDAYNQAAANAKKLGLNVEQTTMLITKQLNSLDRQIKFFRESGGSFMPKQIDAPQIKSAKYESIEEQINRVNDAMMRLVATQEDQIAVDAQALARQGATTGQVKRYVAVREKQLEVERRIAASRATIAAQEAVGAVDPELQKYAARISMAEYEVEKVKVAWELKIEAARAAGATEMEIAREVAEYREALAKQESQSRLATTASTFGMMGKMSQDLYTLSGENNKKMFEAAKKFSIAEALINTYTGATKALAQGGFFGIFMAAAVIIAGLAQVAKIRAATPSGGAGGGGVSGGGAMPSSSGFTEQPAPGDTGGNQPTQHVTINVQNGAGSKDYWQSIVDDVIVPGINSAAKRNIKIDVMAQA